MWLSIEVALALLGVTLGVVIARYIFRRPYELRVGWRYLYSGRRDKGMLIAAVIAALFALAALAQMLIMDVSNPISVLVFWLGMVSTGVFLLLAIFTVFTAVSVLGVALGVAALTIGLAVTTGSSSSSATRCSASTRT